MPKIIARKIPPIGKFYTRKFANKEYKMQIVENNGKVGFKVNNTIYNSPSGAAKSIMKQEVNGWRFWKMDK